jgi:hypothetical protein
MRIDGARIVRRGAVGTLVHASRIRITNYATALAQQAPRVG